MRIRDAKIDDAPSLAQVHVESWQIAYRGILPALYLANLSIERATEIWQGWIKRPEPGQFHLVSEKEEFGIVGFASGCPEKAMTSRNRGELTAIYLLPEYQKQRIGGALFQAVVGRFVMQGYSGMISWMLSENPAGPFYRKMGGVPAATKLEIVGGVEKELTAFGWTDFNSLIVGSL